jgi:hypothetical protein
VAQVKWPEAEAFLDALDHDARQTLRRIVEAPPETRADAIGRLQILAPGSDLEELLILLEEKEWARQWFIERLKASK